MLETVRYLSLLTPALDGIKLQLLHILKGTELAREYEADPFPLFTLDSYCDLVVDCLRLLPPASTKPIRSLCLHWILIVILWLTA